MATVNLMTGGSKAGTPQTMPKSSPKASRFDSRAKGQPKRAGR